MMKNTKSLSVDHSNTFRRLLRKSTATVLMCTMLATTPVGAADPASDQANLNFVGADIESVIRAIGQYTNTTFVIDPRVKGTITLVSEQPVNKQEAFSMLTSVLRLQGFTVVRNDGFAKVVPEADAKLQAGPVKTSSVQGDQIATQIFRLNYESAQNLVAVLRPLISPNNTINANPGTNSLVITDYADNLKRLGKIIAALDAPSTSDFDIIPIRHAVATDIAVAVNRLLQGATAPGAADPGRTALLADSRTNSVIVRAPSAARANLAKSLVAKLDQPTAQPGNVHIVYLKNADATKLAQTLRAVVTSDPSLLQTTQSSPQTQSGSPFAQTGAQGGAGSQLGGGANGAGLGASAAMSSQNQQGASAQSLATGGGAAGFIQADPTTNTLIITASEPVYRNLRMVIEQLDVRRAQVYVESLIVEVSSDTAAELGIQWLGISGNDGSDVRVGAGTAFSAGGNNLFTQAATAAAGGTLLPPGNGLTLGIFRQLAGGRFGLGVLARALESSGNANILSVPNLITLDNEEARIIVGQNVPFITGQYTTAASGGAAGVNPFQTVERKDIGLALRVRPQISEGGTVKMQIYQEVSSIDPNTTSTAGIITNKRSIESNVLVDDGQTIVLGGLIQDNASGGVEKVPGLGDLPFVGGLFRYQNRSSRKTNLIVFIRPTVIRDERQSVNVMMDRYDYMNNVGNAARFPDSAVLPKIDVPTLPPLVNGRMVGGGLLINSAPPGGGVQQGDPAQPMQLPPSQPLQLQPVQPIPLPPASRLQGSPPTLQ
jgi:general secretion pathway protein D